ncbi:hypothetical protein MRB53_021253 [Persea americana]|uniref:Uncharacterized protein n=1 Tax=Persea americana TaxID=3435 RepID=A0ACC2L3I0_PERAE|nr:hypothetical protein MRB53_021253 [Persea americana]
MDPTQGTGDSGNKDTRKTIIIITCIVVILIILSTICTWLLIRKKKKTRRKSETRYEEETEITLPESVLFNLNALRAATDNFSTDNKLGEGGFGPVYKLRQPLQHLHRKIPDSQTLPQQKQMEL